MTQPLPYHCPTLKGKYLKSPCDGQIAEAKQKLAKAPGAMIGFLGKCLECGGKALVSREEAAVKYTGDIRPEVTRALVMEEPMGDDQTAKGKMTPAVARDLGFAPTPKKEAPVISIQKTQEEPLSENAFEVFYPLSAVVDEIPTCPRPDCEAPGSLVKIDKLGRSMGMCVKCLVARGRKVGMENIRLGKTSAPMMIPLNQQKYAEVREWLQAQAEENERTLAAEIMYRLKMSMRGAALTP